MTQQIHPAPTILRRKQVQTRTGLSRSSIYLKVAKGTFPKPISLSERAIGWLESDINEWISERVKYTREHRS